MRTDLLHYSMRVTSLYLYLLIMLTRQNKCKSIGSKVWSEESVKIVKMIIKDLGQTENDSMLYTPRLSDYENCSKSTLACFELEVKVLFFEIQSVAKYQSRLPRILKNLKNALQDKMEACPVCEFYQEERPETFLDALQNVLQLMNAKKYALKKSKRYVVNFMKTNKPTNKQKTLKT